MLLSDQMLVNCKFLLIFMYVVILLLVSFSIELLQFPLEQVLCILGIPLGWISSH